MIVSPQSSSNEVQLDETEVVNKTKHNFKTKIGNKYSAKDVIKVWDCISKWIESNMNQDKGILIKGIGYFTFAQWDINVGKGYPYIVRKPVFVVDEKLAKDFNLKRRRPYNTANIHERYLSLSSVAQIFQLNIDLVTHCFKEIVTAFRKLLHEEKNCELPFSKIGKLQIKNKIITMKFYQEFLERQNQNLNDRTEEEKKKYYSTNYNPDWNADQYEYQKRPCSAMSIINRPASSLSQYRPETGYDGVLPDINDTTDRPDSRLSVRSRPGSRLSVQFRPDSRLSMLSRPDSRLSTQSRSDSRDRPGSSQSERCRPGSGHVRPTSRSPAGPDATIEIQTRSRSRSLGQSHCDQHRPTSRTSDQNRNRPSSVRSIVSSTFRSPPDSKMTNNESFPTTTPGNVPSDDCTNPERPTSKTAAVEQTGNSYDHITSKTENHYDESLCCSCNIRKQRIEQMSIHKPNLSSTDDKINFMTGDNLLNKLINKVEDENKRKHLTKEISNYNYATANELFDKVTKEKIKRRNERNIENCILIKRPTSIRDGSEKKTNFKRLLLDQIEHNKIKAETDKMASLKNDKLMQEELLKNLHEERIKNIEAKARSKENYLKILSEHMKTKIKNAEEMKKKNDITMISNTILSANEIQSQGCTKLNKKKNRELADYQMKQHSARTLASREQRNKSIDYERNLLNQLKEEDETLRKEMLQKKLNQKKYLTEEFHKWLAMRENEHRNNEIPRAYPMTFPLKKMAKRCRLCRKNGLRFPIEKITKLPC